MESSRTRVAFVLGESGGLPQVHALITPRFNAIIAEENGAGSAITAAWRTSPAYRAGRAARLPRRWP